MDFESGSTSYPQPDASAQQQQYPMGTNGVPQDPGRKMLYVAHYSAVFRTDLS